jgi:hypothetical protein
MKELAAVHKKSSIPFISKANDKINTLLLLDIKLPPHVKALYSTCLEFGVNSKLSERKSAANANNSKSPVT